MASEGLKLQGGGDSSGLAGGGGTCSPHGVQWAIGVRMCQCLPSRAPQAQSPDSGGSAGAFTVLPEASFGAPSEQE